MFTVPGNTPESGTFSNATFVDWITGVIGQTAGTFREDVLDVFANDEHGLLLLLHHEFDRDGLRRSYETATSSICAAARSRRGENIPEVLRSSNKRGARADRVHATDPAA